MHLSILSEPTTIKDLRVGAPILCTPSLVAEVH
jgi:hypothetical protein